jgi:two-component system, OmpR family, sensor kinase
MSSSPLPEPPTRTRPTLLPTTLTGRLVLTSIALVAGVSLVVAVVTTLALRGFLIQRLDDQLAEAYGRAEGVYPGDPGALPGQLCVSDEQRPHGRVPGQGVGALTGVLGSSCSYAEIVDEQTGRPASVSDDVLVALAAVPVDAAPHTVDLPGVGSYRVLLHESAGLVFVTGLPTGDVDETLGRLIGLEAIVALLGVGLAAAAGLALVRRQLRPLREVAATAAEVTRTPLDSGAVGTTARVPAEYTRPDNEVGQLGEALNLMLGHVERALDARHESEQQVRQFLADASHELRTPLSTIAGYAELSRRTPADEDSELAQLRHAMDRVDVESERMTALVDDLLLLARLDAGRPLESDEVDLSRLVLEALDDARVVAPDHQWRLSLPDEPVLVRGDEHRLHQVVANLLSNACHHTPVGTVVAATVTVEAASAGVLLAVHDDGPGLPPALAAQAFDRFSRGDESRTRDTGGSGLGLPIVKAIVDAHGGTVTLDTRPGSTTVTVHLSPECVG